MKLSDRIVRAPAGRRLRVVEGGDPGGRPILVLHGSPGSGRLYRPHLEDAAARGIRLIGYDRPGYGGSTANPGRTIADCCEDVRAIADALELPRLAVWGISGGGPHALACAQGLQGRVVAVASLASPAPFGAPGLDYFAGMGELNVQDLKLLIRDRAAARAKSRLDREVMLGATPDGLQEFMKTVLSPIDLAAQTPELLDHNLRSSQAGLEPGDEGWWDDSLAMMEPWGFDVGEIRTPVVLWHGLQDRFVPFQQGEWLAAHIPGVEAHLSDVDGHLTLTQRRIPEVHAWLLEHW